MPVQKKNTVNYQTIAPFLSVAQNRWSRALSYTGLGVGVLVLLCCIQVYFNINRLLKDRHPRRDGWDYISVTKTITNDNMAADHSFSEQEIHELRQQPFIEDAQPLLANRFLVKATGGQTLPFTTDLFLESIDNRFLDTIPPDFSWKEGQQILPIIMAADYLELYNTVFAPSKDLPQISPQSVSAVMVQVECVDALGIPHYFRGRVVGLSDRINSVLVPAEFLHWANRRFAGSGEWNPARVFIKTSDANSPALLSFLEQKQYHINKDKSRFGRIKQVLQGIVSGLSAFGVLVIILAMVLFSFYLQLMIARSKDNLQLLLTLGYSPGWLSKTVARRWIPIYVGIICSALLLTMLLQAVFAVSLMKGREELSAWIHWPVAVVAAGMLALTIWTNYRLVSRLLHRL